MITVRSQGNATLRSKGCKEEEAERHDNSFQVCERLLRRDEEEHLVLMATEHRMRSNSFQLQEERCGSDFMKTTENVRDRKSMERFYRWRPGDL